MSESLAPLGAARLSSAGAAAAADFQTLAHRGGRLRGVSELLQPVMHSGTGFYALLGVLIGIITLGVAAYLVQLRYGLVVTGLRDTFSWGVYITNFVFFIGVSRGRGGCASATGDSQLLTGAGRARGRHAGGHRVARPQRKAGA